MSSQLLLFPSRSFTPSREVSMPSLPRDASAKAAGIASAQPAQILAWRQSRPMRQCIIDAPHEGRAGRMVLSGRFSDVCAALDQMVANA